MLCVQRAKRHDIEAMLLSKTESITLSNGQLLLTCYSGKKIPSVNLGLALLQARAVGCGFILAEARGAVGRLFRDLGGSGDSGYSSRSLRGCLLDPWFVPYNPNTYSDQNGGVEAASRTLTPPMLLNVRRESESTSPLRLQRTSVNGRESASAGLLASSEYVRQQAKGEGQEAAAVPTAGRRAQFHVCFQALHMFWQEHGHLPVILDRDQADEVVRIADEAVETGRNVRTRAE